MTDSEKTKRFPVRTLEVAAEWQGSRLDRWLQEQLPGVPQSAQRRLLRTGQIRLNGGRVKGGERLRAGDRVRLPPVTIIPPDENAPPVPEGALRLLAARTLHRDARVWVVNKPAGMVVHGGSGQPWGLVDAMRLLAAREGLAARPEICHRLDRDTSGCLILGLDREAVRLLAEAFRQGTVEKHYLTLVRGVPARRKGTIDQALVKGQLQGGERMVATEEAGERAVTRYQVVRELDGAALVAVQLLTGRTHQIRAHFQWLGHPLAGDPKYGDRAFNRRLKGVGLRRLFLHAERLVFPHPDDGRPLTVTAPLDGELEHVVAGLQQEGGRQQPPATRGARHGR